MISRRTTTLERGRRHLDVGQTIGRLTDAARSRLTPGVMVARSDVRQRYDDLMERAATAPGSTLGRQLYVPPDAGLRADLLDEPEAGEIPTEDEAVKIKGLIELSAGSPAINWSG